MSLFGRKEKKPQDYMSKLAHSMEGKTQIEKERALANDPYFGPIQRLGEALNSSDPSACAKAFSDTIMCRSCGHRFVIASSIEKSTMYDTHFAVVCPKCADDLAHVPNPR